VPSKPRLSAWKTLLAGAGKVGEVDSVQRAMKTSELKPGYKTTEFWGTIVFHLANLSLYVLGTVEADWAVTASGIVQAVYSIARGMAKH